MLNKTELKGIAETRLTEARILFRKKNSKYEGVVHLCVYAIEVAFKKKICDTLDWVGFPETKGEFKKLGSFKTHNLQILLKLCGYERRIKRNPEMWANWSILQDLNVEIRYAPRGKINRQEAREVIDATYKLLLFLKIKRKRIKKTAIKKGKNDK